MSPWFLIPAVGGLFVGPLIYFLAREAKGHGMLEVMYLKYLYPFSCESPFPKHPESR